MSANTRSNQGNQEPNFSFKIIPILSLTEFRFIELQEEKLPRSVASVISARG